MTPQPSEQPRIAIRERLRKLDDTHHYSWPRWTYRDYVNVSQLLGEAEAAAPDPVASEATAKCPVCGSPAVIRLADNWQEQVEAGAAIPIVGCGNPWHYFLDREAAAPDPVASPAPLDVERLAEVIHARECLPDHPMAKHKSEHVSVGYRGKARVLIDTLAEYARLEGQPVAEEPR